MTDPLALEDRDRDGDRLHSPSAARNRVVIGAVLDKLLPEGARVLEVASGTGEHAAHMADIRPDLRWQPSDPDTDSRRSQDAWRHGREAVMQPSLAVDVTDRSTFTRGGMFHAVFCANMIHIAPWEAAEGLARLAAHALVPGGRMMLYGPFGFGNDTAPSNRDFDMSLKSRNPSWGVRELADVKELFAKSRLAFEQAIDMPANNHLVVFSRAS